LLAKLLAGQFFRQVFHFLPYKQHIKVMRPEEHNLPTSRLTGKLKNLAPLPTI
jgi:hypothetical protein